MRRFLPSFLLLNEFLLLFVLGPVGLMQMGTRPVIALSLWGLAFYGLWQKTRGKSFSWRTLWYGKGWPEGEKKKALWRFGISAVALLLLTLYLVPDKLLQFPREKPFFWLLVMALYPFFSVLPQEIAYRSFFMSRYKPLFSENLLVILSALCFGWSHLPFENPVAPLLATIGGFFFAQSYRRHGSLKEVVLEHALYGCFIFTIGLGWYFYLGNWRH